MVYIDMDLNSFCEKFELEPVMMKCENCKKEFKTNQPIAIKGYRGLEMEKHGCPDNFLGAVFKPVDKDEIDFWNKII